MATRRREIFIGLPGSPPKRVRLEDLEEIVRQVRDAVEAIAEDLGIPPEKRTPVELVDLLGGSTGLAFEQVVPDDVIQAPLAVLTDTASDQVQGLPPPKYLTAKSRAAISETVVTFARLASRGSPVRVKTFADAPSLPAPAPQQRQPSDSYLGTFLQQAPVAVREVAFPAEVAPTSPTTDTSDALATLQPEPGRWLVELSGKVERLDEGSKKLWLKGEGKLVGPLQLDEEQFRAVDGDGVRWQTALVRARSKAPELRADSEVLDVSPHSSDAVSTASAETSTAAAMEPVLKKLRSFSSLPRAWDSYSAEPPRAGAIRDAENLVLALSMSGEQAVPFAAPVASGAVQLEWESEDAYLELEFSGGGAIKVFRLVGDDELSQASVSRARALELVKWFAGAK